MKVLIVGGGAREHALAWKLRQDDPSLDLLAAPGNPGIAGLCRRVPVSLSDVPALAAVAVDEGVDLTVVGPEAPLAGGLVDELRQRRRAAFGPTRAAAAIETNKGFAKKLMLQAGVPTAHASVHIDAKEAKRAARKLGAPVVIKASGLAAGKGVFVCRSISEAERAIDTMLRDGTFGAAGSEILVEQFMEGEELSIFALTDGEQVLPLLPAQDHKRLLDGDEGPNTGGMGSYAPVSIGSMALVDEAVRSVFEPTLAALREQGRRFSGLLYAGLMLTADGLRVVEFNCRFGDPETEVLLPLMTSSLLEPIMAVAAGVGLAGAPPFTWSERHAVATVVAARGYPERPATGDRITLPTPSGGVHVFHAGTALDEEGRLVTSGGRVFAVTAIADSFDEARERSRGCAEMIRFEGRHFRTDIGWRESSRHAGAA